MKHLLIAAALILAPVAGHALSADQTGRACDAISSGAETIMDVRQNGKLNRHLMRMVIENSLEDGGPLLTASKAMTLELVDLAWQLDVEETVSMKRFAVTAFSMTARRHCMDNLPAFVERP